MLFHISPGMYNFFDPNLTLSSRFGRGIHMRICLAGLMMVALTVCISVTPGQALKNENGDINDERALALAKESTVFEQFHTMVKFRKDGSWEEEEYCRARVESEGGVHSMGKLVFGYGAENQRVEVLMARAIKKDGTIVEAGSDSIIDVSDPFAGMLNEYTDYRQKHILVPGLRPGDIVEYRVKTIEYQPLAPGQFWFDHQFKRYETCLHEKLMVILPAGSEIKLRYKPKYAPAIREEASEIIYEWTSSHLPEIESEAKKRSEKKKSRKEIEEEAQPDVQLTTFANWEHVASWYKPLQQEQMSPNDELRKKTSELIRDCKTDLEKIQAIYSFVASSVRYASISFGIGRFVPHRASQVLDYRYGDCKDKHTLLAAMLRIAGYQACPALTNSSRKIIEDQPSPGQFNHLLTVVHLGDSEIWLDTTIGLAPFGVLSPSLMNRKALLVHLHGASALKQIPHDTPFPFYEDVAIKASLSDTGTITGKVSYKIRGYEEIQWREIFRGKPEADRKNAATSLNYHLHIPGEVSNVVASDPLNTQIPFQVDYEFVGLMQIRRESDTKQMVADLPLQSFRLPWVYVDEESDDEPIDLGYPIKRCARLTMELPSSFNERLPLPVSVKRDYGEYASKYEITGNLLAAERKLELRAGKISGNRAREHMSFVRAVEADNNQRLIMKTEFIEKRLSAEKEDMSETHTNAIAALDNNDYLTAIQLLKRVTEIEPKHLYAWNNLGRGYLAVGKFKQAIECFEKQISINPVDEYSYNNLGSAYQSLERYLEAEQAFRKQIDIKPLDQYAHSNLASLLFLERRYEEALPELEKAITINPKEVRLRMWRGAVLFQLGRSDEGFEAYETALKENQGPNIWRFVAYSLAKYRYKLDFAKQLAESIVQAMKTYSRSLSMNEFVKSPQYVEAITALWGTVGFVYFQSEDYEKAEKYLASAWELGQHGENGFPLGELYLKRGEKQKAISQIALSLSAFSPPREARTRLAELVGEDRIESLKAEAIQELIKMRTLEVSPGINEDLRADFYVVLSSHQPSEVKFLSGDEKLHAYEEHLKKLTFPYRTPDDQPMQLVRCGELKCLKSDGRCQFVLELPRKMFSLLPSPAEIVSQK
jgi:tetratricopeptide (TPR) repeat protein